MSEPVVVFRSYSDVEAAIVQSLLDSHGIESSLSSDNPHVVFPLTNDGVSEVRLTVCAEDAVRASQLIEASRDDQGVGGEATRRGLDTLEALVGYAFQDRGLLEHALTHRSRANEDVTGGVTDNESLEFLGDAVLGFVMADLLFRRFPNCDEGEKSKMKARLVSSATLSVQASRLDLGRHLLLGRGEEKSGGRSKQTLLADTYEALIAAIYLDGGLEAARTFIEQQFAHLVGGQGEVSGPGEDFKSALQEHLQARGRPLPEYTVVEETGPAHRRLFRIEVAVAGERLAHGEGKTKKEAEQDAARAALTKFAR